MMNSHNGSFSSTWTPAPRVQARSYNDWLIIVVSVGQTYGVATTQWNEALTAAARDISTRVWALNDDARQMVSKAVAR